MRIAVFADTFHPAIDGVVTCMDSVARELMRRDHAVRFFVPAPREAKAAEELAKGLDVHTIASVSLPTYADYRISPPISRSASRTFETFAPEVVHAHSPFSLGWIGLRCARRAGIPIIATYHTVLPELLVYLPIPLLRRTRLAKALTWKYTALFYNRADLVTAPSAEIAKALQRHHGKEAAVLSNPVRFNLFNRFAETPRPDDVFRLVFFGRVSFEKNIDVMIETLRILCERGRNAELWIIGSGPAETSLRQRVRQLNLAERVVFHGALRQESLAQAVAQCHCMATASTIENQPLTIPEAMAAGLPCVGVDCMGIPGLVKNGENGFLFPPFEPGAAADRIEGLIDSAELRQRVSTGAIETARSLSESTVVDRYLSLYEQTIAANLAGRGTA
jgi:glycosyltransferase involved in cell wall biosynthesis